MLTVKKWCVPVGPYEKGLNGFENSLRPRSTQCWTVELTLETSVIPRHRNGVHTPYYISYGELKQ